MAEQTLPGDVLTLRAPGISSEVWGLSSALHHVTVTREDGRTAKPFAEALWQGEPVSRDETISAHLRFLGGEWPCLPFGATPFDNVVHGYATDNLWQIEQIDESTAKAVIDLPGDRDLARLTRVVTLEENAVSIRLEAEPRHDCTLPIGLHPIFAPPVTGDWPIACRFSEGRTFPVLFEPGASRLAINARFSELDLMPLSGWRKVSIGDLFERDGEEAAQLMETGGVARLADPETGLVTRFSWDKTVFPHVLLWISNKGRKHAPWSGRFRGLGFEPVSGQFVEKGGRAVQIGGTDFRKGETFSTEYRFDFSWMPD